MQFLKGKSWRTKGYKTCNAGEWRVDIIGPDGKTILKSYQFEVVKPEAGNNPI